MNNLSKIINALPYMKSGSELRSALEVLPEYDAAICDADTPVRPMAPFGVDAVVTEERFKPHDTTAESKLQDHHAAGVQRHHGWYRLIGASGIGKSSAISRAIALITENQIIEVENPYTKIIPCICVQCPLIPLRRDCCWRCCERWMKPLTAITIRTH